MQQLICDLERIVSQPVNERDRVLRVADRLQEFVASEPVLDPRFTARGRNTYARHLVHRDAQDRFTLVVLVWEPGQGTSIHDHGTWGMIGALNNKIASWVYERRDDGVREGTAELEEIRFAKAEAGSLLPLVLPPDDEIHRIKNDSDGVTISIHVYGKDILRCRRYDINDNHWEWYNLSYTTVQNERDAHRLSR